MIFELIISTLQRGVLEKLTIKLSKSSIKELEHFQMRLKSSLVNIEEELKARYQYKEDHNGIEWETPYDL